MVELDLGRGHHFKFVLTGLKGKTPAKRLVGFSKHFRKIAETFLNNSYKEGNHALDLLKDDSIDSEAKEMQKGAKPRVPVLENLRRARLIVNPSGNESGMLELHLRQNSPDEEYEGWNHAPTESEKMLETMGRDAPIRIVERHQATVKAIANWLVKNRIAFELHAFQNNEWHKIFEHKK